MTSRPARKRIWRKRLTRALLCLVLGAATTMGVAWGSAHRDVRSFLTGSPMIWTTASISGQGVEVGRSVQPGRAWATITLSNLSWKPAPLAAENGEAATVADVLATARVGWAAPPQTPGIDEYARTQTMACGWPWLALKNVKVQQYRMERPGDRTTLREDHLGIKMSWRQYPYPIIPYWPGFLLDTLFYAAPWWLILIAPGAIRRSRRRRRGRCIHCGYDLAGLPGGTVPGGTVLRTVTNEDDGETGRQNDTARRAVPPTCPECGQLAPPPR